MRRRMILGALTVLWVGASLTSAAPPKAKRPTQVTKPAAPAAAPQRVASKPAVAPTADDSAPQAGTRSYKLRYKFKPGEKLRWEVEHRVKVRTTVQGSTQTAETFSGSIKVWQIDDLDDDGNTKLTYSVERVEMKQKYDGRQETHYDSTVDKEPPPGYDGVAAAVGKKLAELTLSSLGSVVKREEHFVQAAPMQENVTLPLPENSVAVGEEWTMPADITVTLPSKTVRKIKARQVYRLESVDNGIATIHLETQVLTPLNDPVIESQLVQSKASGTVKFDIAAGRIVEQQSDVDEHVHGFSGPASNMHYVTRFTEKLLPDTSKAAVYPQAVKPRTTK